MASTSSPASASAASRVSTTTFARADRGGVELARRGEVRAHGVHVRAGRQQLAVEERSVGGRARADDVGVRHRLRRADRGLDAALSAPHVRAASARAGVRDTTTTCVIGRTAHMASRWDCGLDARAEDHEPRRVLVREGTGGQLRTPQPCGAR